MNEIKQKELIDQLAGRIQRLGLVGLAASLIESLQPFALIGGQLLWLAQPAASQFIDSNRIADYACLLENPEALDLLRNKLEEG